LRLKEIDNCKPDLRNPLPQSTTATGLTRDLRLDSALMGACTGLREMTFGTLPSGASIDSNKILTISGSPTGTFNFDVTYTTVSGVLRTTTISYTVVWAPVDGPNYYPVNSSTTNIENIDASAVTCILSKITACISSNYLRVIKFDFTGCSQIVKNYNGSDSICNTSSQKTETVITSDVTHFKGCRVSSSSHYIGGFMIKMAA
jgi:hypothetical protein